MAPIPRDSAVSSGRDFKETRSIPRGVKNLVTMLARAVADAATLMDMSPHNLRHSYGLIRSGIRRRSGTAGIPLQEKELEQRTSSSRTEVREVLSQLAEEGVISRRRRSGTQLQSPIVDLAVDLPLAYRASSDDDYRQFPIDEYTVPSSPLLEESFEHPTEQDYLCSDSVIQLNGIPLALRTSFWRGSERRRTSPVGRSGSDMVASFVATFGTGLHSCEAAVSAVTASAGVARQLSLEPGAPILLREAVLRGTDGLVHELNFTYYAAARVSLQLKTEY